MSTIYLDNAATTRVVPQVASVVTECMTEDFGNPSSAHHMGISAEARVKRARDQVLAAIGDPDGGLGRLLWTSGGTESDALAVLGAARARKQRGTHVLYSAIEHPAVRESMRQLGREGFRVECVPVNRSGVVDPAALAAALTGDTQVVAVMLVNNEIGTIQPIADIVAAVRRVRADIHVHCDAVQALGKLPVDVRALGVDSLALAAHKLHGPKGVGALWLKKPSRIIPLWSGGGQQDGLRSGTLNVPGIAGMGEAARLSGDGLDARRARWTELGEQLLSAIQSAGVSVSVNGRDAPRCPHILSLAFAGIPAEPLLHVLESRGVLVSAGSACSERSRKASPVLEAIGVAPSHGTIRFSFGRDTTAEQIETAARIVIDAVRDF